MANRVYGFIQNIRLHRIFFSPYANNDVGQKQSKAVSICNGSQIIESENIPTSR